MPIRAEIRICFLCGIFFPWAYGYGQCRFGGIDYCLECRSEGKRIFNADRSRRRYAENPAHREYMSFQNNKTPRAIQYQKDYRQRPEVVKRRNERMRERYRVDPEYRARHREACRKWRRNNPDKLAAQKRRHRERKKANK